MNLRKMKIIKALVDLDLILSVGLLAICIGIDAPALYKVGFAILLVIAFALVAECDKMEKENN